MAEGFARALKADQYERHSTGIETQELNSHDVRVIAEAGLDLSTQQSTL